MNHTTTRRKLTLQFRDKCKFLGYDGPKQALQHCISLGLGSCQTADKLQSTWVCVKKYAAQYGLEFPDRRGYN